MTKEKIQDKIDKLEQKYQDAYEYYGFASHELVLIEKQIEQLENDLQALIKSEQSGCKHYVKNWDKARGTYLFSFCGKDFNL
jgi:hypothetical protein